MEKFYLPSSVACQDPLCELLKNAWLELYFTYYNALGRYNEEGKYEQIGESNLATIPLVEAVPAVINAIIEVTKVRGILDAVRAMPQRSAELDSLIQEIAPQFASLDMEIVKWYPLLLQSIREEINPAERFYQIPSLRNLGLPSQRIYGPEPL